MKRNILTLLSFLATIFVTSSGIAQEFNPCQTFNGQLDNASAAKIKEGFTNPKVYQTSPSDLNAFLQKIANNYNNANFSTGITLPNGNGQALHFTIKNSDILGEEFQTSFPSIKTFKGISADGKFLLRLTISPNILMAKISDLDAGKEIYLQPLDMSHPNMLIQYEGADPKLWNAGLLSCLTDESGYNNRDIYTQKTPKTAGLAFGACQLRTFRLAVAAEGQYTNWAGGQSNAATAIAATVNNITAIYERDMTITFTLVTNNNIIFTDSTSDPYSDGVGITSGILTQNINTLNNNAYLGSANYDIGVLFGNDYTWSGGLAYLGATCNNGTKGGAAGGLNDNFSMGPSGPIMETTMAHEMGHQFKATHTMSANTGGCSGNVTGASAWETGGGSTLMAYAGVCTGLAYQSQSDHYFHAGSVQQINTYLASISCGSTASSGNTAPTTSTTGNTFNIPNSTPFKLMVTGTDADGNTLTYAFDQMDAYGGSGTNSLPSATATSGPLFRSMYPSTVNYRYFPSMSVLTGATSGNFEVLPTVARTMNFKAAVRDNNAGAGCLAQENFVINTQNCGPFGFTNLNTATSLTANGTNTVTLNWNTASSCVTTPNVKISFSTDGGKTYPFTVLSSTANDGTETIVVPNLPTCDGRFMIEAIGNIYFNINRAPITILSSCSANGTSFSPSSTVNATPGSASLALPMNPNYGSQISLPISGTLQSSDPASTLVTYNSTTSGCSNFGNAVRYDQTTFTPSVNGSYTFSITGPSGLVMNIYEGTFDPNNLCQNFITSTAVYNGSSVSLGANFTTTLCPQKQYTIVVESFNSTTPALPASYSISATMPSGAGLYTGNPNPGGSYNYGYVIVNNTTALIKAIVASVDMQNAALYPAGNYTIYGISTSSTISSLNTTYANTAFSSFNTAVLNQSGGLCAQMATNVRSVVIATPTPINLIEFSAKKSEKNTALLSWSIVEDQAITKYIIERSIDGNTFAAIGSIQAKGNGSNISTYNFEDKQFASVAQPKAYYRVGIVNQDNKTYYTQIASLTNNDRPSSLNIYPNPVNNNQLNVTYSSSENGRMNLQIIDIIGRVVYSSEIVKDQMSISESIPLKNISAGVYHLSITLNGTSQTSKFVKE